MKIHKKLKVTGKVQGVFFRASTQQKAFDLGITGIVRNEPDGSVYIEAEGMPDQLKDFIHWCSQGPAGAIVKEVKEEEGDIRHYDRFTIQR